jgi:CheY-like chemotaxis protein
MKVKKTIVCVDDHEQSLSIRKLMLETRGYRVIVAPQARRPEKFSGVEASTLS